MKKGGRQKGDWSRSASRVQESETPKATPRRNARREMAERDLGS